MTASFQLALDTTAPAITWGAVSGATAGDRLRVGYTVDEPGVASASVELADGRTFALVDNGLTLEANLPPDAPAGWATVRALVRDDVWNEATRALPVQIAGVIVQPEPTPATGGLPSHARRQRRRPDTRTIRARTPVATTSSSWLLVLERGKVGIAVTTSAARSATSVTSAAVVSAESRGRVTARRVEGPDSARTLGRRGTVTRRDGPTTEALLLDLI